MGVLDQLLAELNTRNPQARMVKSFDQGAKEVGMRGWSGDKAVQNLAGMSEELQKALSIADAAGFQGTGPLQLENLDQTLTEVLFTEEWIVKFNAIPRVPSKNVLYQWNQQKTFGTSRAPGGFTEGKAPTGGEPKFARSSAEIKFWGEKGGVTHQVTVSEAGMQLDPVAVANRAATIRLLEKIERWLIHGDKRVKDSLGTEANYDGILRQLKTLRPKSIIDKKGAAMTFDDFQRVGWKFREDGKLPSLSKIKGYGHSGVVADLAQLKLESERSDLGGRGKGNLIPGTPFGGFQTQAGFLPLLEDSYMDAVEYAAPLAEANFGAPDAPATVTGAAASDATSELAATTYYYFVAAFNDSGESLPTATAGVAVLAAQKVTLTIARVTAATGYRVYRSLTNDATAAKYIGVEPQPASGNASFVDLNEYRPGTGMALFFNTDASDICVPMLAPLTKWPLAITSTTIEFLLLMYHTLAIKAPERVILVRNIAMTTPA